MCLFNLFKKKPEKPTVSIESNGAGDLQVVPVFTAAQKKYYVGVGINAYASAPLNGCVNDIEDMFGMLTSKFGFQRGDNMRLLCDSRATKAEILNRLGWLVSVAKEGDICVFNYSGHGAQLPARKSTGEVDGIDEVLCPFDFNWSNGYIIDDQLGQFADQIAAKGAIPIFIIDACHSGTILRDIKPIKFPKKNVKITNRFMPLPIDIAARIKPNLKMRTIATNVIDSDKAILIAGCKENQTSADAYFAGRYNGALTYNLVKILSKTPDLTYSQLEAKLAVTLENGGFNQIPLVVGSEKLLNRKVFN